MKDLTTILWAFYFCVLFKAKTVLRYLGMISAQEGTENIGPPVGANILETQPAYGVVVYIPPVQRHYVYPGPLPLPGISWPIVGSAGIGYRAEGRFPYSGYVGNTAPYLRNVFGISTPSPVTPVEIWRVDG